MRIFFSLLVAALLLAGCGAKRPTPAQMNPVEYQGHVSGILTGYWAGEEGYTTTSNFAVAVMKHGIPASLAIPGTPAAQLNRVEGAMKAFAQKTGAVYSRQPSAASLTWPLGKLLAEDGIKGVKPKSYDTLYELADLLNQDPELLILVHAHDPMVRYSVERGLRNGAWYVFDVVTALNTSPNRIDKNRIVSFGCADGPEGSLTVTLVPKVFVANF